MSLGELYGEYDLTTDEWADGVLSSLMRSACAGLRTLQTLLSCPSTSTLSLCFLLLVILTFPGLNCKVLIFVANLFHPINFVLSFFR